MLQEQIKRRFGTATEKEEPRLALVDFVRIVLVGQSDAAPPSADEAGRIPDRNDPQAGKGCRHVRLRPSSSFFLFPSEPRNMYEG